MLQAFQQGASLHEQGRLWEAEQLYNSVLRADKRHFGALCRLGVIRLQQGRLEEAAGLYRRALKADKGSADAHHGLAFALTGLEQLEEAVDYYRRALVLRPGFAEAHNNLGHALQRLGRFEAAIAQYETALALNPAYAEARNNLGNTLHLLGRNHDAIAQYEQAIAIQPDYAEAHWNCGNAFRSLGRPEEAIAQYEKALELKPNYAEAYNSLGNILRMLARSEEAAAQYRKALAVKPDYVDAHINLGIALSALGREEEALVEYARALTIKPGNCDALSSRGDTLARLKRHKEALASYEQALVTDPDHSDAFNGLLLSAANTCDWARTARLRHQAAARVAAGKFVEPFTFLGYCGDPALQLACAKTYIRHKVPELPPRLWTGAVWRNDQIRIAYLASGFHGHPTGYLTAGLIELHDRHRFEILGISTGPDDGSEIRARLVRAFDQFFDVRSKNDREVAALIHDLQIDIVIDRSGYTANARAEILACRPAPIQVSYIGFPGSLGADFYDYVIADRIVLPFGEQQFHIERIVHLPDTYLVTDSKLAIAGTTPSRQQAGLPEHGFVFCCFNNNNKITAPVFDVWIRLLHQVDGSVLWLLRSNAAAEINLKNEAAARGIDPTRLIFADRLRLDEHLARHRLADLFLDTLPYNAHTTASDALWAGLPLVTCLGEAFAGRVSASLLNAIGLPELITNSLGEYELLALRIATDPSLLRRLRDKLRHNRIICPLFDTERYRRHIEAAYMKMWEIWQRGDSPRSFTVEALANAIA
jgi:predicted O-linked N-acetylglucosamine transferase (SPINDLY family)